MILLSRDPFGIPSFNSTLSQIAKTDNCKHPPDVVALMGRAVLPSRGFLPVKGAEMSN